MNALIDLGNEDCYVIYLGIEFCNLIDLDVSKAFKLAVSLGVCGKGFYKTLVQYWKYFFLKSTNIFFQMEMLVLFTFI